MARLKKRYWIPSIILLIIMMLGLWGWRYWLAFKEAHHLLVDWQGLSVSFDGVSFDELTISQQSPLSLSSQLAPQSPFSLKASNLKLSWSALTATSIDVYWQPSDLTDNIVVAKVADNAIQESEPSDFDPSLISTIVYWIPKTISVDSFKFYQQKNQLVDLKIEAVKTQNIMQLNLVSNRQYTATLSANILFDQLNSRFEINNGLLTATLNQFGIEKGTLTLPFAGVLTNNHIILKSTDKASLSIEKAKFSDDLIIHPLLAKFDFDVAAPIPFESKQINAKTALKFNQFNGIYKASEFKSVVGDVDLLFNNNRFTVSTSALTIQNVNIGVNFEKIKLAGTYSAPFNNPSKGIVKWQKAQANVFSGLVFVEQGKLNFAKLPQHFNLRLKNLQLRDIFAQYPAEGLAGDGAIDGIFPVTFLPPTKKSTVLTEVIIKSGQLVTVNEGYLQFDNSSLRDYAQVNPKMKILTDIIKNFHYTKLVGTVNYANDIAKLGLNIQGSNRDVENGKAVNLNINLEENVAKLLITLQLSDQISEPIRKRIEAYLKRKS
jgi:hypothetical protein